MQSGDDDVLRAMGRHYSAAEYLEHIGRVRAAAARGVSINVTTDVIVGFPTEDEAAFERTLEAVDAAGITRVHVFPYSPRPGTVAADLGDRVEPAEKKRRSQVLRGRSELRSRLHRAARLGTARAGAHRQGRRRPMLGLHRRLHALLPAGRRRAARGAGRRGVPGAPRRRHAVLA